MRRSLLPLLFVSLLPVLASAQEAYSVSATANQVTDLTLIVAAHNGRTCERLGQAEACTQAQACTAASAPGGASCTAAQARGANARIFPATLAGREEFVTFQIAAPRFQDMKAGIVGRDKDKQCEFWTAANTTQRNQICTDSGRPAGCSICP